MWIVEGNNFNFENQKQRYNDYQKRKMVFKARSRKLESLFILSDICSSDRYLTLGLLQNLSLISAV